MYDGLQAVDTLFSAGVRRTRVLRSAWSSSIGPQMLHPSFTSRDYRRHLFLSVQAAKTRRTKVVPVSGGNFFKGRGLLWGSVLSLRKGYFGAFPDPKAWLPCKSYLYKTPAVCIPKVYKAGVCFLSNLKFSGRSAGTDSPAIGLPVHKKRSFHSFFCIRINR